MAEVVVKAGEGEVIPAGPSVSLVKVAGEQADGRTSVIEMNLDPGWDGPSAHVHAEVDHVWVVMEGTVEVTVEGSDYRLGRGDVAWVPHGHTHRFGTGDSEATMMQIDTPRSLDGYFRDLAAAFPRGTRPEPALVTEIMARHDTRPVGA